MGFYCTCSFFTYNVSGFNGIHVVFQASFDFVMSTLY